MLRIRGGKVYDPANGVNGEVRDICIQDGRVVADVEGGRSIDATGCVVFPGGVDVHTHVAGAAQGRAARFEPTVGAASVTAMRIAGDTRPHKCSRPLIRRGRSRERQGGDPQAQHTSGASANVHARLPQRHDHHMGSEAASGNDRVQAGAAGSSAPSSVGIGTEP